MKTYGGGDILDEKMSPFGKAFTPVQCIHYALTRPAVAAVMLGCKTIEQWNAALAYCDATDEEKDYATALSGMKRFTFEGHCMYCGHCAPCPSGIDVAAVTKFLNLTIAQGMIPETVREHYKSLKAHASECVACGACGTRCPFKVKIIDNMKHAAEVFGCDFTVFVEAKGKIVFRPPRAIDRSRLITSNRFSVLLRINSDQCMNNGNNRVPLIITLGLLSAFGPFVTDMYLPSLPEMQGQFWHNDFFGTIRTYHQYAWACRGTTGRRSVER